MLKKQKRLKMWLAFCGGNEAIREKLCAHRQLAAKCSLVFHRDINLRFLFVRLISMRVLPKEAITLTRSDLVFGGAIARNWGYAVKQEKMKQLRCQSRQLQNLASFIPAANVS